MLVNHQLDKDSPRMLGALCVQIELLCPLYFALLRLRSDSAPRRVCKHWNQAARGLGSFNTAEMGNSVHKNANSLVKNLPVAFDRLSSLSLNLAKSLTDDGLVPIGKMSSLKELDLSYRVKLTYEGTCDNFKTSPRIRSLTRSCVFPAWILIRLTS